MSISIYEEHHMLQEIAAVLSNIPERQEDFAAVNWPDEPKCRTSPKELLTMATLLYQHKTPAFSKHVTYELWSNDNRLSRNHKPKMIFYKPLWKALLDKSKDCGMQMCLMWLHKALYLYFITPLERSCENWIIEVCVTGARHGMSETTERFLLQKTWIDQFIHEESVLGSRSLWKFKELVQDGQTPTISYIFGKLTSEQRQTLVETALGLPLTRDSLSKFHLHRSSYVLANSNVRGRMFGIICYNEFENCSPRFRREGARREAEVMRGAMVYAGIETTVIRNWAAEQLHDSLKAYTRRIKDECSAVFVCVMSHGSKGVVHGNNDSSDDDYAINRLLQLVGEELPTYVPKIVVVQACQKNRYESNKDALPTMGIEHIEVTTPETVLLMSTVFGENSNRNHFIPALAEYLQNPDGETSLHQMYTMAVTRCQRVQQLNADCDWQKPLFITTAKDIIIPRP